jgi:serine/threonine protein kinase
VSRDSHASIDVGAPLAFSPLASQHDLPLLKGTGWLAHCYAGSTASSPSSAGNARGLPHTAAHLLHACRLLLKDHLSSLGSCLGTFNFCAPEVLLGQKATLKADVFSYGVLLYQMLTGEPPVRGLLSPLVAPRDCPQKVTALQQRCLDPDPQRRPSAGEIVAVLSAYAQCPAGPAESPARLLDRSASGSNQPQQQSVVRSVVIPLQPVAPSPMQGSSAVPLDSIGKLGGGPLELQNIRACPQTDPS